MTSLLDQKKKNRNKISFYLTLLLSIQTLFKQWDFILKLVRLDKHYSELSSRAGSAINVYKNESDSYESLQLKNIWYHVYGYVMSIEYFFEHEVMKTC